MKKEKELNELKEEVKNMKQKLAELSEDELNQVTGGTIGRMDNVFESSGDVQLEKERNHIIK